MSDKKTDIAVYNKIPSLSKWLKTRQDWFFENMIEKVSVLW